METQAVNLRPLVISPLEDHEFYTGEEFTCYTHKAVKAAMSIIESKYPNSGYMMHHVGPWDLFNLIDLTRSDCIKLMNKIIIASNKHGYINADNKVLEVKIEVKKSNSRFDKDESPSVKIYMGSVKLENEEE
jgi:outer membrane translocation and assembly module TamA